MAQTEPLIEPHERIIDLPDFFDDAHKANHETLIAAGYRYYGTDNFLQYFLYQQRFREDEQNVEGDPCYINFKEFDKAELRQTKYISYEADVFCEREKGRGFIIVEQSGIDSSRLAELIPQIEAELRAAWRKYARNGKKESE